MKMHWPSQCFHHQVQVGVWEGATVDQICEKLMFVGRLPRTQGSIVDKARAWLVRKRTSGFKGSDSNTAFLKHAVHALEHMDNSDGLVYWLIIFMAL